MKAAIATARQRVLVEFYIVEDEGVAAEVGELLLRKAAEGVRVALMYDSLGSVGTDSAFFDRLRQGGIAVCAFNPLNPLERPGHWGVLQRNHRKMLAVDSEVAFTGGINLSNVYAQGSFGSLRRKKPPADADAQGWRDTQIELHGPVGERGAGRLGEGLGPGDLEERHGVPGGDLEDFDAFRCQAEAGAFGQVKRFLLSHQALRA